ncbi:hypothetical protein HCH_04689 [Hahella chejuensis KCTC 2396]|uniref:Uncharacterized protein n=1 Tax=Hahella chejuensis (strain KCTC 2396) TaxID=349521 RepID=Q2SD87_HAHCH|nr:hypothetical protein HCH_04689 [Hahella chejuensis KCTC 2396]
MNVEMTHRSQQKQISVEKPDIRNACKKAFPLKHFRQPHTMELGDL